MRKRGWLPGDLVEANVERTVFREQTFARLLVEYEKSGRIVLDDRAVTDIREAFEMCRHNLQIVGVEVLASRLGWDDAGIERLRLWQSVLKPIVVHARSSGP